MTVECDSEHSICAWFQVGFLPTLQYEMYDVAIELPPNDAQKEGLQATDVNFRILYVSEEYTEF